MKHHYALWIVMSAALVVISACGSDISDPGQPTPATLPVLGHGIITSRYTAEIAVRNDWAYTSTWNFRQAAGNAVFVWNVADDEPMLVDSVIIAGASTTGDVQVSDDGALLVVATELRPGSIVLYDLADPAHPQHIGTHQTAATEQGVHTVKLGRVDGRQYAFLSVNPGTTPSHLVIVDVTDPAQPTEVLSRDMGSPFVHDVFVRDGILMTALWNGGLSIWDIGGGILGGTPANPLLIGNVQPPSGRIHNIWWFHDPSNGSKRYVFLGEEGPGFVGARASTGDIHVIDISDMTQPVEVGIYSVPNAGTHNFWMDEASGILYAAYYNGGVRALDVRGDLGACAERPCDLSGRERGAALTSDAYVWGVVHRGDRVFASDMLSGIYSIDVSSLVR